MIGYKDKPSLFILIKLTILLLASLTLANVVFAQSNVNNANKQPNSTGELKTTTATNDNTVSVECLVEPWTISNIGSHSRGVVANVLVDRGEVVKQGQALIELESEVARNQVQLAKERALISSELAARDAELRLSQIEYDRMVEMYDQSLISSQERDKGGASLKIAQASYLQAVENRRLMELQFQQSLNELKLKTITSPTDGVVVDRLVHAGELAHNNSLMVIADLHPLRIEVVLPGEYFGRVKADDIAKLTLMTFGDETHNVMIDLVDPVLDPRSGTFGVRLALPNSNYAIPSGQRCRVDIELDQSQNRKQAWIQARQNHLNERQEPRLQAAEGRRDRAK